MEILINDRNDSIKKDCIAHVGEEVDCVDQVVFPSSGKLSRGVQWSSQFAHNVHLSGPGHHQTARDQTAQTNDQMSPGQKVCSQHGSNALPHIRTKMLEKSER